jgi:hypothetical protein
MQIESDQATSEGAPLLTSPECFFPNNVQKPEAKECKAKRTNIRHSVYKLAMVAKLI